MKRHYKCFCEKPFFDLTKEELTVMIRRQRRRDPKEVCDYYNIDIETYWNHIKKFGFHLLREERERLTKAKKNKKENTQEKEEWEYVLKGIGGFNIPDFVVCALHDVSYEMIDGKRYYDQQELNRAKESLSNKVKTYMLDTEDYYHEKYVSKETSKLKPIDLVAMRMYRGYNRKEFVKRSGFTMHEVVDYESKGKEIPKWVAKEYMKALSCKVSHVKKLRSVMKGESEYVEEDRQIPRLIKLEVWLRDKGNCTGCGVSNKIHYHHIKRFADGGLHNVDNIKLLCPKCHAEEHKGEPSYYMLKKMAEEE